ncbi:MAG: nucleoside monophosphate kinase [Patescibacteria group bacterium]|nr:nucleoside monophosphate kinase [Patescibacteria group bacterium]
MAKAKNNKLVIVLLGRPGAGKDTQQELLKKKFGLTSISTGDLLRQRAKIQDFTGKKIGQCINSGNRMATPIAFYLWMQKLEEFAKKQNVRGFIVDGSPRTVYEAEMLEMALDWYGWANKKVIYLWLSAKESMRRLTKRRICQKCGEIIPYIGDYKKLKKCPRCEGSLVARADDTREGIKKRLAWFKKEVLPVVNYFRKRGELRQINGEQPIEKVFQDVLGALKK